MITQVIFKIEKKLKDQAMKKAQDNGIAFAYILKLATKAFVDNQLDVVLAPSEKLNLKTRRELSKISMDIKERKNLSPSFNSAKEALGYLKS